MKFARIIAALSLLSLTGCASYGRFTAARSVGYDEQEIDPRTYTISFVGNANSLSSKKASDSPLEMIRYLFRRSAEFTLEKNYKYFTARDFTEKDPLMGLSRQTFSHTITLYSEGSQPAIAFDAKQVLAITQKEDEPLAGEDQFHVYPLLVSKGASKQKYLVGQLEQPVRPIKVERNLSRGFQCEHNQIGCTFQAFVLSAPYQQVKDSESFQGLLLTSNSYESNPEKVKHIKKRLEQIAQEKQKKTEDELCFQFQANTLDPSFRKSENYSLELITDQKTIPLTIRDFKLLKTFPKGWTFPALSGHYKLQEDIHRYEGLACTSRPQVEINKDFGLLVKVIGEDQQVVMQQPLLWTTSRN
jgi:hypothetical protein